ncbi:hypothetical protein ACRB9V_24460, partial [Salmonella enterica subsp. enterica serovar Paratyphi A]
VPSVPPLFEAMLLISMPFSFLFFLVCHSVCHQRPACIGVNQPVPDHQRVIEPHSAATLPG